MSDTATLAFEIGTEEIPAFDLKRATEQLAELVLAALDAVRIPHGEVAIYTSPRRLIAIVTDVAARTEALEEVFRGPAAKIAFDEAGNPTKAAIGFARGKGLDVDALERRDENGTEYVYAVRQVPSQDVAALLPEAGFEPKQTTRKSNYVTYFKPSETIADFLTAVGAPLAAMEVMNAKLEKHLRGSVNRRVNCDSANLDKAVDAALLQVEAIQQYSAIHGLDALPDKLRETARLRAENPELTLAQLAALCDPPVTKSCLNHRLRKLMELARG